jgi:hypothetical protein
MFPAADNGGRRTAVYSIAPIQGAQDNAFYGRWSRNVNHFAVPRRAYAIAAVRAAGVQDRSNRPYDSQGRKKVALW